MKISLITIFLVCTISNGYSQLTVFWDEIDNIGDIIINEGTLYGIRSIGGEVYSIDLQNSQPNINYIPTGLYIQQAIEKYQDYLLVVDVQQDKIVKIHFNNSEILIEDYLTELSDPCDIEIHNNTLYILECGIGRVSKINLTNDIGATEIIMETGMQSISSMAIGNENIFLGQTNNQQNQNGKILRVSLEEAEPIINEYYTDNVIFPISLLYSTNHNSLFYTDFSAGKVIQLEDNSSGIPTASTLTSELKFPNGLAEYEEGIYITDSDSKSIYRFQLVTAVFNSEIKSLELDLYQNPTKRYIIIKNKLEKKRYVLVDIMGRVQMQGVFNNQNIIDLQLLIEGNYYLKVEGYKTKNVLLMR